MYAAKPALIKAAIAWIAGSLHRKFRAHLDADTLESAVNYGVAMALREFEPAKLTVGDFKTYLHIRGRQRAIQGLRAEAAIFERSKLGAAHRRQPPHRPVSLDSPLCRSRHGSHITRGPEVRGENDTLYHMIGVQDANAARLDDRDEAAWLVSCLPERLKRVVQLHFLDGLTVKETARLIPKAHGGNGDGISPSRVSQLLGEACSRLRRRAGRRKVTA